MNEIKTTIADELHAPAKRNFPRRKVIMRGIDETWQADLVDMQKYSGFNKSYKYILTIIDNLSKCAWAIPLQSKTGVELMMVFKNLFKKGRIPKNLHVDQGTEFYNANVKKLLEAHNVHLYSTFSEKKASSCKKFNRSLKTNMWKLFSINGNYKWFDILDNLVSTYNNRVHRSIRMKPVDVSHDDEERLVKMLNTSKLSCKRPKFELGDHVRLSKYKGIFEKGYPPNWGTEIFTIVKVQKTKPVTYKLKDYQDQHLDGAFYEFELIKVKYHDVYLVEKIVKRKGNKVYVKWLGFDSTHNKWEDKNNI